MLGNVSPHPDLIVEYTDPVEGFKGWLVIDSLVHNLCAGGLRVQKGLTCSCVENLAATMTLKMRIAGIRADGAKSGIDYDPNNPGKEEALYRFIRAIRPYILERYSMGPDMNTTMPELDAICSRLGISSIKTAVANAQQYSPKEFNDRIALLTEPVGHATLGKLRAGAGLAASCLGTLDFLDIAVKTATVTIQGFGGLATGAAYFLHQAGVKIIAIADHEKSLIGSAATPLDIPYLLEHSKNGLLPENSPTGTYGKSEDIYTIQCDVFIPAAIEEAVCKQIAGNIPVKAITCGANLAVIPEAQQTLHDRGIFLVPDMIAGCGGSMSMEGLFAPDSLPTPQEVLHHVHSKTRSIVKKTLSRSKQEDRLPRDIALQLCSEAILYPDTRPYGKP
jgi:glutamate dehydrogenase (NAD(P)+)